MSGVSKTIVVGNLGRDPEMQYTPNGTAATRFSVAASRQYTNPAGEKKQVTTWFQVTAFGKLGEIVNQYCTKGMTVYVEGELVPDESTGGPRVWTRKDGTSGASFEIRASSVVFLSHGQDGEGNRGGGQDTNGAAVGDEDLPF